MFQKLHFSPSLNKSNILLLSSVILHSIVQYFDIYSSFLLIVKSIYSQDEDFKVTHSLHILHCLVHLHLFWSRWRLHWGRVMVTSRV